MNHTATPWIVIGENCGGGCNIGIEFFDSKGIKHELVFARTVAVRNPADLHGRAPIEAEEAAANAMRLVEALNQYEWLSPPERF
jgi:hypothetical protein